MLRNLFLLTAITIATELNAQAPHVIDKSPAAQVITAPANAPITVIFDAPMDISTINDQTFRVFGKWSGPAMGTFSFSNDNKDISFQPSENFFAGEFVMVQLSKGIRSSGEVTLQTPYAWTYWIAAAPGVLNQTLADTIELRLPNEGLIQTYGAYAGDMNNDGFSDLVTINENSDDLRILMNDGQGGYPSFTMYDTGIEGKPSPNEGADFNNDGEIDFVVTSAWYNEVRVLTGDGQGGFSNMDIYYTSEGVRGVVVGDFDGDGWDDMLTTNRIDGNISIFMNDGDGTFTISGMDVPGEDETACAITDINNDGMLDIFYASYESETVGILLGNGDGSFTYSTSVSVEGRPWHIGEGDFNGDGYADIASANSSSDEIAVLFGDGQGGLSAPVHYSPADADFPLALDVADIDGDGDLDFVTSNHNAGNFNVFENDGYGQFNVAVTLPALEAGSCAILHDRDNDGDIDITGADEDADVLLLYENAGAQTSASVVSKNNLQASVYPNPTSDRAMISGKAPGNSSLQLSVFNGIGTKIETSVIKVSPTGNFLHYWEPTANIKSGVYFLKLETGDAVLMDKLIVDR